MFGVHSVLIIALILISSSHLPSSYLPLGGTGQPMGPRPAMGVTTPRAMPPYKYATTIRNTQPQVVQPITLQQVIYADRCKQKLHQISTNTKLILAYLVMK